jgi:hypothetical protein
VDDEPRTTTDLADAYVRVVEYQGQWLVVPHNGGISNVRLIVRGKTWGGC